MKYVFLLIILSFSSQVFAQHDNHSTHAAGQRHGEVSQTLLEGGQAAFSAIQEIVNLLVADPNTDWSRVSVERLRQHLIDMNNVTMRATVATREIADGAVFEVTSNDPAVQASIQAMIMAHAATMDGVNGWILTPKKTPEGATLRVVGNDRQRIIGMGFIGVMTYGVHHQEHHLALAKGMMPH